MYRDVFRNSGFVKLWGAQIASQVAAQLLNYGLLIRIYEVASGTSFANSAVSLLIVAIGIPAIFLAVPAGAYVDRCDRRAVLIWTNLLRAALVPLFLVADQHILPIYVIALLISVFSQFFVPAEGAALPLLVGKKHLVAANSLFIFTLNASFIIGYSLAAPLIASSGIHAVYFVVTASFLSALALSILLPKMPAPTRTDFSLFAALKGIRKDLKAHFKHIVGNRSLLFPILLISIAQTIVGIIAALSPALAHELFGRGLAQTSHFLVIPAGIGLILGSFLAGRLLSRMSKIRLIYTCLFAAVITMGTLVILPSLSLGSALGPAVALSTFSLGALDAMILVASQTLLQLASTDEMRGQIFGTLNMMINIAALAPVFFAAILADLFSPLVVLGGVAVALGLLGLLFLKIFRKISRVYA